MKHLFIVLEILIFLIFEMNLIIKILEIKKKKKKKSHTEVNQYISVAYTVRIATLKLCHLTLDFTFSLSNAFYILIYLRTY